MPTALHGDRVATATAMAATTLEEEAETQEIRLSGVPTWPQTHRIPTSSNNGLRMS